jgi:hypothetical protein
VRIHTYGYLKVRRGVFHYIATTHKRLDPEIALIGI